MHGSIWELSCWTRCPGAPRRWRDESVPLAEIPPRCPSCGGLARPAVVWFGEPLDPEILARCDRATACDVFLTVGTSALVSPAASLVHDARRRGAFTAEINLEATPASDMVDVTVRGPAEEILAALEERLTVSAAGT